MRRVLPNHPNTNLSDVERWGAVLGGGALVAYGLRRGSWDGALMAALGGSMVVLGAKGYSPMHEALGINTAHQGGKNTAIPYELGIRVDKSIVINKGPEVLYTFWRNLENLPRVMEHLVRVDIRDEKRSHWVASSSLGHQIEWDAEIVNDVPNRVIGWRSLESSEVASAGSVQFRPLPNGRGTEVRVELQYNPPAGSLGAAVAKLLGANPARQIQSDLKRFRMLMETGQIISTEGQPAGPKDARKKSKRPEPIWDRNKDVVQEASEESFPASDAPSWTPETLK